jgi:CRISPR-associated endonuclease/helicase Cas3
MNPSFDEFFKRATSLDQEPFPFQKTFAGSDRLHQLIHVPTGLGKTAMVVLGWTWRRLHADDAIRTTTPRRLVYCLPMRVLVEQTRNNAATHACL